MMHEFDAAADLVKELMDSHKELLVGISAEKLPIELDPIRDKIKTAISEFDTQLERLAVQIAGMQKIDTIIHALVTDLFNAQVNLEKLK